MSLEEDIFGRWITERGVAVFLVLLFAGLFSYTFLALNVAEQKLARFECEAGTKIKIINCTGRKISISTTSKRGIIITQYQQEITQNNP